MTKWARSRFLPGTPLGKDGKRVTASKEHIEISKNAAKEGMVLLKNEKGVLPLCPGTRVALFGKGTFDYVRGGGGSAEVNVPYYRNIYDGIKEAAGDALIFPDTADFYKKNIAEQYAAGYIPGMTREPELPDALLAKAAVFADTAVISISRFSGENWDRKSDLDKIKTHKDVDVEPIRMSDEIFEDGDYYFSEAERAMIKKVSARFKKTVVLLNVGSPVETAWLAENPDIDSVLLVWQGGMEGGLAAAELLYGIGSPSGKLADTFARDLADYPSSDTFYESDEYVDYFEDIYVGYRYFETIPGAASKVVYPFGYGLSYTTFELSAPCVTFTDSEVNVSVRVGNTGKREGREVVQVYFSAPQGKLGKPARQLAGFFKTKPLAPGEEQTARVCFKINDMASYDDLGKVQKSAYVLEKGEYRFYVGADVRSAALCETVYVLNEDKVTEQLTPQMVPTSLSKRMLSDGSFEPLPVSSPNDPNACAFEKLPQLYGDCPLPAVRELPHYQRRLPADIPQLTDVADGKMTLKEFIASLTDEDLAWLLGGQPNTGLANTYGVGNDFLHGVPNIMTADGPAGVRFEEYTGVTATAFPCATLLACTWDPEVIEKVGVACGLETKENNLGVLLTPAVCIHRNPLCGRNFEYYSEDPLLSGKLACAMVRGIQSQRVAATPKHLALNDKESNRKNSDSRASERAIREIYLKQFEIIVKESGPWTIMSSYNIINGHRASENRDLLVNILRGEWGFDGAVFSDWWTYGEHYKEVMAGNDIKMATGYPDRLLKALDMGVLTREAMETAAENILNLILRIDC